MMQIGEWTLHRCVRRGGQGEIWEATTHRHDHTVVIKLLRPERAADRWSQQRLAHELQVLAGLRHRGVVRLLDGGVLDDEHPLSSAENGAAWLAMERIAGRTLAEIAMQRGDIGLVSILRELLDVLSYVHGRGHIHRDLSPQNVMWSVRDWCVKVIDFGLAQSAGTAIERRIGTEGYVAPEVYAGATLGPQADLYSVGRIGMHLLEQGMRHSGWVYGLPLDRLVMWLEGLQSHDPAHRPPTAAAARCWLDALLEDSGANIQPPQSLAAQGGVSTPLAHTLTATATREVSDDVHSTASQAFGVFWGARPSPVLPEAPPVGGASAVELGWMCPGVRLFVHRPVALVARKAACDTLWAALRDATRRGRVLCVDGPDGVGVTALLQWMSDTAHRCADIRVMHTVTADPGGHAVPLWLLDDATEAANAFARQGRARGLVVLGRGDVGERLPLAPIPHSHRAALVRAMLPVSADVAGWFGRRFAGNPRQTREALSDVLSRAALVLGGDVYDWAEGQRPQWTADDVRGHLDWARAAYGEAANEEAWSCMVDLQQAGHAEKDSPHYAEWLDLVLLLADRLPQVLQTHVLPRPTLPPQTDPAWWQVMLRMGQRALRQRDHAAAEDCFSQMLAAANTPTQRAAAMWQRGATDFARGDFAQALSWFEQSLAHCPTDPPTSQTAHALLAQSLVLSNLGLFDDALQTGDRATQAFSDIGQPRHHANLLDFQGSCHLWLGNLAEAERCARDSLAAWARDGSPNRLVPMLNLVAALHHQDRRALVRELLDEIGARAVVEQPHLMGVVALYGVLFAANDGQRESWEIHWQTHEAAWQRGEGWHPATGRMLWDIWQKTQSLGWAEPAGRVLERLHSIQDRYGAAVLSRFGVPAHLPTAS